MDGAKGEYSVVNFVNFVANKGVFVCPGRLHDQSRTFIYMSKITQRVAVSACLAWACGCLALPVGLLAQEIPQAQSLETQGASTERPIALSLEGAVRLALKKSPTLEASVLGVAGAKYDQRKNKGALLPTIKLSGSYTHMLKKQRVYFGSDDMSSSPMGQFFPSDGIEMGQTHSLQGGISAGLPLIAPQLWASLQLDKEAVALAEERARGSQVDLEAEVRKAYMAVLLARESLRVLEANYANAQTNYTQTAAKYEHGLVAEYDKIRMETQVKNILPNVVSARTAVSLSEAKLKVVMGLDLDTPIEITETLADYTDRVYQNLPEQTKHISLEGNSQLRQLDLQGRQLDAALKVKRMAFLPTLSMSFTYQYSFASDRFRLSDKKRWSPFSTIGLSLDIPVYTGGKRYYDLRSTETQIRQLVAQRVAAESQLRLGVMNSLSEQRKALEQFASARDAVATAERGHKIAEVRYKSGASTVLELNDAEMALLQARLNYSQAVYNYMVAVFSLDALRGTTLTDAK